MKLFIIANRLPVKAVSRQDTISFVRSEGGLATGLSSLQMPMERHWIGWPGMCVKTDEDKEAIRNELERMDFHPVFLSDEQYRDYYEGYSNSTIWPLCHYFFLYTLVKRNFLQSYREVNQLFCDEVCRLVQPGDWVWVQDYHLMLLPGMLRKAMPGVHIGYFHHIPFPSYELFRILPERAELLKGLLGADFIAFHTYDYVRHFVSTVERVLHLSFNIDEVQIGSRFVRVDALPMGINYDLYHNASQAPAVWQEVQKNRMLFGKHKMILSVDRLDYSKGILHRLQGYETFLEQHPEYHGKVTLAMVIVPSRDHVGSYNELKTKIDEKTGEINGKFSSMNWTPVCYFYHGFSFEELAAMYFVADVALVTPLRDGMNLVAKEYVATKVGNPGVLILSEMAGAAAELADAIQINPNDTDQIASAIYEALEMPFEEQMRRLDNMQKVVSTQTVNKWASDFMHEWQATIDRNLMMEKKTITTNTKLEMERLYRVAHTRLILLDYDGTLAPFCNRPEEAAPTPELKDLLSRLCADTRNHVVISSGRDQQTLEQWLGNLPLDFAAEHGASYKENGVWHRQNEVVQWSQGILSILNTFVAKTPHSHLEKKETGLAWHYREVDPWLGELRAQQLVRMLYSICARQKLQVLQGNKVVEVKPSEYTKGSVVQRLLANRHYDFILSIGDDTTDEDMFMALPPEAITIKVGAASEWARYSLEQQFDVVPFLEELVNGSAERGEEPDEENPANRRLWNRMVRAVKKITNITINGKR